MTTCDKVKAIVVHRDSSNEATQKQLTPVLPHGIVELRSSKFLHKVCNQRNCLDNSFPLPAHINIIGDQHNDLLTEYRVEPSTRMLIKSCEKTASFIKAWCLFYRRFPDIVKFCSGAATVLPGKSDVESDFSILSWEKIRFASVCLTLLSRDSCRQISTIVLSSPLKLNSICLNYL